MSEQEVTLPWIDEPMALSEAIETVAQVSEDDDEHIEDLEARIEQLEHQIAVLEDGTSVECPDCGSADDVYKSGVGAAKLANDGSLSDRSADAVNEESHLCFECHKAFTPTFE
ncbi:MAG: hypothetical protein IH933_09510 [Euryarchaeota archaeon]|jgi:transposase-like protein|nr:hypothetical protein [Euryarchaeota archaeon]